jgi:hypothetical protein
MQRSEQKNNPENSEQSGSITATAISVVHGATGPRTELGKEKSRRNALKHGIFSSTVLLKDEQRAKFDSLLSGLRDDLEPQGTLEEILVDKLASLLWRHRRLMSVIVEGERPRKRIEFILEPDLNEICPTPLEVSVRYETTLERAFDRALNQLEELQRIRKGQPVSPTLNVHVSS